MQLKPEFQRFIDEELKAGRYDTAEQVIEAALAALNQQEQQIRDFEPGELDRVLAEGERDLENGDVVTGEQAYAEFKTWSAESRGNSSP